MVQYKLRILINHVDVCILFINTFISDAKPCFVFVFPNLQYKLYSYIYKVLYYKISYINLYLEAVVAHIVSGTASMSLSCGFDSHAGELINFNFFSLLSSATPHAISRKLNGMKWGHENIKYITSPSENRTHNTHDCTMTTV